MWHGANWNYILWGLYYGILLLIEKYVLKDILAKLPNIFQHAFTLFIVVIGWALFRIEDLTQLTQVLRTLFVYESMSLKSIMINYQDIFQSIPFIILAAIGSTPFMKNIYDFFEQKNEKLSLKTINDMFLIGVFSLSIVFLVGEKFNPFIYFKF